MMHHAAQYNFPAPIITSRGGSAVGVVPGGHYSAYDPRTTSTPATMVAPQPPTTAAAPATTTATRTSSRASSEFRGSTNPSEDWTKISDLAERRRIQNRIAQRNYRKKLKRRLEDLERRAQSRSLSPNEESGDGRSTRESSSDNNQNVNSSKSTATSSNTGPGDTITVSAHPAVTSTYEYAPAYTTAASTGSTPYPSQYRTAGGYSSTASPTHYASGTYETSTNHFTYSGPYDSHNHSSNFPPTHHSYHPSPYATPDPAVDPSLLLPVPTLINSSSASTTPTSSAASSPSQRSIPSTATIGLKTQSLYDLDNSHSSTSSTASVTPYILTNSYDTVQAHDHYHYSPAGVSSSFYNLDYTAPLPPLLGHNSGSTMNSPATPSSIAGDRYVKKENPW